jgi:hypothetical protein
MCKYTASTVQKVIKVQKHSASANQNAQQEPDDFRLHFSHPFSSSSERSDSLPTRAAPFAAVCAAGFSHLTDILTCNFRTPAKLLNSKPGATIMADDNDIHQIPIKNIISEDGAHELATSPDMKPYLEFIKAVIQDHDPAPELDAIRQLPLEKRYVWRVASALKWGLADCESMSVEADMQTLTPEEVGKVMDLMKFRPMQTPTGSHQHGRRKPHSPHTNRVQPLLDLQRFAARCYHFGLK